MKWNDVRNNYPEKFVLFEIIESEKVGDKEVVDDIKVIEVYDNGKDARNAFIKKKPNQFVYSTKNERVEIEIVKYVGIRRNV